MTWGCHGPSSHPFPTWSASDCSRCGSPPAWAWRRERVLPAVPLVAPFAVAAHLANALRDWEADAADGSSSLVQVLGRGRSRALALVLGLGVATAMVAVLMVSGRLTAGTALPGAIGLAAMGLGVRSDAALWRGILVAAVCWTAAWALATG